jgi:hypothetical protein
MYHSAMGIMGLTRFWAFLNLAGLICGVMGALFLFYSLALKPSNFRLVKVGDKKLAICLDNKVVVAGYGGPLVVSDDACPVWRGRGRHRRSSQTGRDLHRGAYADYCRFRAATAYGHSGCARKELMLTGGYWQCS